MATALSLHASLYERLRPPVGDYKYLAFQELIRVEGRKTAVYSCRNKRSGEELGQIRWYGAWRQYCYFPTVQAVYSAGCLRDIAGFMAEAPRG